MPTPEPRNRPAPIALPSPIMISWRGLSARSSFCDGAVAGAGELAGIDAVLFTREGDTLPRPPGAVSVPKVGAEVAVLMRLCSKAVARRGGILHRAKARIAAAGGPDPGRALSACRRCGTATQPPVTGPPGNGPLSGEREGLRVER